MSGNTNFNLKYRTAILKLDSIRLFVDISYFTLQTLEIKSFTDGDADIKAIIFDESGKLDEA